MNSDSELRNVSVGLLDPIAIILEINDDWKKLMARIPNDLESKQFEPKYNNEDIRIIEEYAHANSLKAARILFDEWGTSGKVRPTLRTLQNMLVNAHMFRAADRLAKMLNEKPPPRPKDCPAAHVTIDYNSLLDTSTCLQNDTSQHSNVVLNGTYGSQCNNPTKKMGDVSENGLMQSSNSKQITPDFDAMANHYTDMIPNNNNKLTSSSSHFHSETSQSGSELGSQSDSSQFSQFEMPPLNNTNRYQVDNDILNDLISFPYTDLQAMTRDFTKDLLVGSGGFGEVFKGNHVHFGLLAIKRAHNNQIYLGSAKMVETFSSEVKSLSTLRHENVVPILGYSLDGPAPCIICEYIEGGSLLSNIQSNILDEKQRMKIIIGTADGLRFIHNTVKPNPKSQSSEIAYFLHGDVKSANILISKNFVPKLCDFGLSKQYEMTHHTQSIVGTLAYMAPERRGGTITLKGDIYSYGVVLLELLTGKEAIIPNHSGTINIIDYVEDNCINGSIMPVLDDKVKEWSNAESIYGIAKKCLAEKRVMRPTMNEICDILHNLEKTDSV